jgi:hypothetical protein
MLIRNGNKKKIQIAEETPFDNNSNGFTSVDVQAAIEEAYALGANASRGPTTCGFDGTASTGRWLEFFSNNPSNNNPFIIAEDSELIAVAIVSSSATATGNARIFVNGVNTQNITLTAQKKNRINGLNISLNELDEISVQITSGSISRPNVYLFIRTLPV